MNKRLFGTKTTYDFNKYTTKLDETKITPELRARAEAVEKEIANRDGKGMDHHLALENEEEEFSNVIREDKVVEVQLSRREVSENRKQQLELRNALMMSIGATANGTAENQQPSNNLLVNTF